jgi:uncharacterized phage protein gp47/JayE
MPLIITSNGKAKRVSPLSKLFFQTMAEQLSQLHNELMQMTKLHTLDEATGEALDKLSKTWGIVRKDELLGSTRD